MGRDLKLRLGGRCVNVQIRTGVGISAAPLTNVVGRLGSGLGSGTYKWIGIGNGLA
jgi:hypothetical protein